MKKIVVLLFLFQTAITINAQKYCINWPEMDFTSSPWNLSQNWDYIETLPFDGVVIFTPEYRDAMTPGKSITYKQVFNDSYLGELSKKFKRVRNNFLIVWSAPAPFDPFDNCDRIFANFAVYAKAAHDAGCSGIILDTEQYRGGIWQYPGNVSYSANYTIEQYREQYRLRGKQIMNAMIAEFPDIQVMVSHGPYWSEPQAYIDMKEVADQLPPDLGNLVESFYVGLIESVISAKANGHNPKFIDGGELYAMRDKENYAKSYKWRKYTIASKEINSASIPASVRAQWPDNVSISFGHYNLWEATPAIIRNTLEYSLQYADDFVWFYSAGMNWYSPGGVSQDWMNALRDGINAGCAIPKKKKK